jgi:hypothetical protein
MSESNSSYIDVMLRFRDDPLDVSILHIFLH